MVYSANDIADYIVYFFKERDQEITNLKLQKLLYYVQAWHLVIKNEPAFRDSIEAWVHGPVIPSVYATFKHYRNMPITKEISTINLPDSFLEHVNNVLEYYGDYTAFELEHLTHQSDPWIKARGDRHIWEACTNNISNQDMKEYYQKMAMENAGDGKK